MTKFIFTGLLLVTGFAHAQNSVFRADSPVPAELQERIITTVENNCHRAGVTAAKLVEVSTTVTEEKIDQGVIDYTYQTTLQTSLFTKDAQPIVGTILVESKEYSISNPEIDRFDVVSFTSNVPGCIQ